MAPDGYLRGLLADGAQPFHYRCGVRALLGEPVDTGVQLSFALCPPRGGFPYVHQGTGPLEPYLWEDGPAGAPGWLEQIHAVGQPASTPLAATAPSAHIVLPGVTERPAAGSRPAEREMDRGGGAAPGPTGSPAPAGQAWPTTPTGQAGPTIPIGQAGATTPTGQAGTPVPAGQAAPSAPVGAASPIAAPPVIRPAATRPTGATASSSTPAPGTGAPTPSPLSQQVPGQPAQQSAVPSARPSLQVARSAAPDGRRAATAAGPARPGAAPEPIRAVGAPEPAQHARGLEPARPTARPSPMPRRPPAGRSPGHLPVTAGSVTAASATSTSRTAGPPYRRGAAGPTAATATPAQQATPWAAQRAAPPHADQPPVQAPVVPPVIVVQAPAPAADGVAFWERRHLGLLLTRIIR